MMKKLIFLLIPLCLLTVAGCRKTDLNQENIKYGASITASTGLETKTALNQTGDSPATYAMTWTGDETLNVYFIDEEHGDRPSPFLFNCTETNGTSAVFNCDTFDPEQFVEGNMFAVGYKVKSANIVNYPASTSGKGLRMGLIHPVEQTYTPTPGNILCLENGIIPMYGLIKVGQGAGYEKYNIQMHAPCAVIKLYLTNSLGADKTIGKITLTTSATNAQIGVAGRRTVTYDGATGEVAVTRFMAGQGGPQNTTSKAINLNCGNTELAAGSTKLFGFVVASGPTMNLNTLTFQVFDENDTQLGGDIAIDLVQIFGEGLDYLSDGKVYSVSGTL